MSVIKLLALSRMSRKVTISLS